MAQPSPTALQTVGAFRLDVGPTTVHPVQVSIPLQAGIDGTEGEEVLFFRKGMELQPGGSFQPIWWIVDNGFIARDAGGQLVARTASAPYSGIDESGEYMLAKALPGVIGEPFALMGGLPVGWASFVGLGIGMVGPMIA